MTFNSKIINF